MRVFSSIIHFNAECFLKTDTSLCSCQIDLNAICIVFTAILSGLSMSLFYILLLLC